MESANRVLREELSKVIEGEATSTEYTGDFLIALGLLVVSDQLYELNEQVRRWRHGVTNDSL